MSIDLKEKLHVIDGFGAHQGNDEVNQQWWLDLYYKDLGASIYRVDITPRLTAPYSDLNVYSPWFMGSGTKSVFNFEDTANPNGPENNRVRTYTSPQDYSRTFGGRNAPIAVMGPNIVENIKKFTYSQNKAITTGKSLQAELGDFKLIGSLWSPVPWVKISSGSKWSENWWPGPVNGASWPFIWGGNYAGGKLDVSDTPLEVFDDSSLGGTGKTSSLTQFARSSAAYISGYQKYHGVKFYAISIQNELNFEQFYNSMTYPLSSQYIKAVKAIKAEFNKHDDLRDIKIMGPEDLLGFDPYGMWQYGGGNTAVHKNLQYLQNLAQDAEALKAVDFFCIHGYAPNGVNSAGSDPIQWKWWSDGWTTSPAAGIPANVKGFKALNKKSWMTETSGENNAWLFPANAYPSDGGFSVVTKIHQAITAGNESAWIYWTFTDSNDADEVSSFGLTNQKASSNSPKYVAAKHFYKFIRPNSNLVKSTTNDNGVSASAYTNEKDKSITIVLINTTNASKSVDIELNDNSSFTYNAYTSNNSSKWQASTNQFTSGKSSIAVPAFGVVTIYAKEVLVATNEETSQDFSFTINPNPASQYIEVKLEDIKISDARISVFNIQGTEVYREDNFSGETSINVEKWVRGVYFVSVRMGERVVSGRVLVE